MQDNHHQQRRIQRGINWIVIVSDLFTKLSKNCFPMLYNTTRSFERNKIKCVSPGKLSQTYSTKCQAHVNNIYVISELVFRGNRVFRGKRERV